LEEAKKTSSTVKLKNSKKSHDEPNILMKENVIKILNAVYDIIDPLIVKINQNFKNERRKFYEENNKYLEIIKTFEKQKTNLITFTLKSVCKAMKVKYSTLQESVFNYIQKQDEEVIMKINSFQKIGKVFALAPKKLAIQDVLDILKLYYENLNYMIYNSDHGRNEYVKYALVLINDLIYENYGLEEEQIFAFIEERNLIENSEINGKLTMIQNMIKCNIGILFDI